MGPDVLYQAAASRVTFAISSSPTTVKAARVGTSAAAGVVGVDVAVGVGGVDAVGPEDVGAAGALGVLPREVVNG